METYSDEYIEFWADKFIGYGIHFYKNADEEPITFEEFLQNPVMYIDAMLQGIGLAVSGDRIKPMLRSDRAAQLVQRELESEVDEVCRPVRLSGRRLMQRLNPFAPPKASKCGGHGRERTCV